MESVIQNRIAVAVEHLIKMDAVSIDADDVREVVKMEMLISKLFLITVGLAYCPHMRDWLWQT